MATKGKTILNKVTGEKITWLEATRDSAGKHLVFELEIAPKGFVPVRHIHPNQDEHFEILSGTLQLEVNGTAKEFSAGETILISRGQPHQWWNRSTSIPVKMKVKFQPALKTEVFFEQFFGLSNDGKTNQEGSPTFMQIMAMTNRYSIYIAGPPVIIQKTMGFVLGGIARLFGIKSYYKQYSE